MKAIIPVLLLLAGTAHADVYKTITPSGEVIYSDVRTSGARQMNVPEPQTYTPAPLPVAVIPQPDAEEDKTGPYETFVIDSPVNEETIRNNLGNIEILVTLEPELNARDGHRIVYYMNDKAQGRKTVDMEKTLVNVDRGEHLLSAAVLDRSGEVVISTAPVKVFMHRASIQHPNNPLNPVNNPPPSPPSPPAAP